MFRRVRAKLEAERAAAGGVPPQPDSDRNDVNSK
jgi:hypothetical protein